MGVENVLTSALYTETLEKVVVTSSLAAVVGSRESKIAGYLYSEADWNEVATETNLPYLRFDLSIHVLTSLEIWSNWDSLLTHALSFTSKTE